MIDKDLVKISGNFTIGDWIELRIKLFNDNKPADWDKAIEVFVKRIESRFLEPIEAILSINKNEGEGFSASALMCLLIEYLEAFYQGKIHTTKKSDNENEIYNNPFKYSSSIKLFKEFLTNREPFKTHFSKKTAEIFYNDIRCGLLHEAATKGDSLIKDRNNDLLIEKNGKGIVLYRTNFLNSIKHYIELYKSEIKNDTKLKKAFIRKMDSIAQIGKTILFAYGSLLKKDEIEKVTHNYQEVGRAFLKDYEFVFNKISDIDRTSKANIRKKPDGQVWGFCYEIDKEELGLFKEREKKYELKDKDIKAYTDENTYFNASVFISDYVFDKYVPPDEKYFRTMLEGAKQKELPDDYFSFLTSILPCRSME